MAAQLTAKKCSIQSRVVIRVTLHGVHWDVRPDLAPHLEAVLASEGSGIKESPVKLVTRHEAAGRTWFIKRYRHCRVPARPLKYYFKPSQARQEWDLALRLERLGIPIVRHAALGERWGFGLRESILVTEGFDGQPLDETPDADMQAVMAFVQTLHDRGVLQRDLHPGNILRHAATGELRLVDLHGTVIRPTLRPEEREANLATLRISLPIPVAPAILELSRQMRRKCLVRRARRCLRHNRDFEPRRIGPLRWQVRRVWMNAATEAILGDPDGFLASRAEILKAGRSSTVGRADERVLKRFNLRKPLNVLKDLFRWSKARRAFFKAYHLEIAGVPTARPIAVADRRVAGFLWRSYFLMEEIADARHLGLWVGDARQAVTAVAEVIARLHEEGFTHRDLKETNLVFDVTGKLHLIDLEGLEFLEVVPRERALRDLARLEDGARALPGFTPALRRQFVRRYTQARGLRPRAFFRPVAQSAGAITPALPGSAPMRANRGVRVPTRRGSGGGPAPPRPDR